MGMPKNVQDWVKALRSGEYQQVEGTLRGVVVDGGVGYCCLGVYLEAVKGISVPEGTEDHPEGPKELYTLCRTDIHRELVDTGIEMNDVNGQSFTEIADMIEEYYNEA